MALIDRPEAARRLARAIASDLALYNEKKVIEGIQNDNLFEAMAEDIREGVELYNSRVSEELRSETNFFERALVDVLLKSKASVESDIW